MKFDLTSQDAALEAATAAIHARIPDLGNLTWADYCARNDHAAVAHLDPGTASQILRKRGTRHPVPFFEDDGTVSLRVPVRFRGQTLTALVNLADWITLQEGGYRGLWCVNASGAGQPTVKAWRPMARGGTANMQPIARVILKGDEKSRAKFLNGNSFDLRRKNLQRIDCAQGRHLTNSRALARDGIDQIPKG
ncbi:hypothetical protein C8J30_105139 [Rhodobacter viridis]|uniref:Uncharacterized protein n=1 Tax=Rhodobacter viridis TaxID=1054202 RepID=A0A318U449_9RHOB|nr:hypothetical protein [Rhodobacter viridis]PYF10329.1 hypothetical protein C8J30_105139 [Rhodobacter viridis]